MSKQDILEMFNDINHAYNDSTRLNTLSRMLDELVDEQQTIDAVEVVRCGECRYRIRHVMTDDLVFCSKPYTERGNAVHRADWYCADGERRCRNEID